MILLFHLVVVTHRNRIVWCEVAKHTIAQDGVIGRVDNQRDCCYPRQHPNHDLVHGLAPILFSIYSERAGCGIENSASAEMGEGADLVMTTLAAAFATGGASDEPCPGKGRTNWHKGVVFSRDVVPPDELGGIGRDLALVAAFFPRRDLGRVHHR